jgi:hypothetical protein
MTDGLLGKCKECTKTDVKTNRRVNREQIVAYEKRRANLPKRRALKVKWRINNPGKRQSISDRWGDRNPQKRMAIIAANNAVRDGRLNKKPCAVCGRQDGQAHHEDYSRPLDVIWLCRPCHAKHHVHKRLIENFWRQIQAAQRTTA